jgi:hypothetical protein
VEQVRPVDQETVGAGEWVGRSSAHAPSLGHERGGPT